jgi:hypothetical protein
MTKYLRFIVLAILGVFSEVSAQDWEVNLATTQVDRSIGGNVSIMVQIRSIGTPLAIGNVGTGLNINFFYNNAALDYGTGATFTFQGDFEQLDRQLPQVTQPGPSEIGIGLTQVFRLQRLPFLYQQQVGWMLLKFNLIYLTIPCQWILVDYLSAAGLEEL